MFGILISTICWFVAFCNRQFSYLETPSKNSSDACGDVAFPLAARVVSATRVDHLYMRMYSESNQNPRKSRRKECFLSNVQPDTCRDSVGLPGVAIRLFPLFWRDTSIHVFDSAEFVTCQSTRCRQIDVANDENCVQLCLYSIFTFTSVAFVRAITSATQTLDFHHPRNNFPRLLDQSSVLCE